MAEKLDYSQVRPENKWKILRAQWRFALWALYSSIGSTMLGFDLTAGLQMLAIVTIALIALIGIGSIPKAIRHSLCFCSRRISRPRAMAEWMEWSSICWPCIWLSRCNFLVEPYWSQAPDLDWMYFQRHWHWTLSSQSRMEIVPRCTSHQWNWIRYGLHF